MGSYVFQPRGKGYAFRIAVPKDLRGRFKSPRGKPLKRIIEGLGTDSVKEAEAKATKRRAHWLAVFERAAQQSPLSLGEIQAEATEVYRSTLARMAAEAATWADLIGDEATWLRTNLERCQNALAASDFATVQPDIEAIERRKGVTLGDTEAHTTLARAILRAQIAAINGRLKALDGQTSEAPTNFLGADGIDPLTLRPARLPLPVIRLRNERGPWALFEQWVAAAKPAASTVNRWRAVFLNLQSKFGQRDISEDDAREWARELVGPKRSPVTVSDVWLSAAKTVYAWAAQERFTNSNPFATVKVTVPEKIETRESKAFTSKEAATILRAALTTDPGRNAFKAAKRWVPWLQGYSGARSGEIAQLRGRDIFEQDGLWVMRLTPEAGTIKTRKPRLVPLHEHLIAMGFLDFVASKGDGPLFYNPRNDTGQGEATKPKRPRPVKTRERLAEWVRSLGIDDREVGPTHGWRHLFKQTAEGVGISEKMSDYITGHAPANVARKYGVPKVADVAAALAKFPRYRV